ncbi:hypothetical protein OSJ77_03640 [Phyllobacterium sp. 0TCS1.6C]|jgi:hypothetical protein|uniref:hypothetical protein n=1 Tax=unclassified Phyllobacterium TaxID=2638441 RepID=UPI00226497A7|nr:MULTISPECIES: hypothetical protein [unclassified Phyllobacterium]MCX8279267.1 hypothetical protein [Phyllobacterium sp. 0TCS1.6C]MCX8294051.1 hypothetical protein [Phyllobacterium sp. 0TCS1.6A]
MLQSAISPNIGHAIVHHFGEGAAVWGRALTPSIAHAIQGSRTLTIDYSLVHPDTAFETVSSGAMLPHVINDSKFRVHVESSAFRRCAGRHGALTEALVRCDAGAECILKLWGTVVAESSPQQSDDEFADTVPVIFAVTFWEISLARDLRMEQMLMELSERDKKIRELELKVALSMCSE